MNKNSIFLHDSGSELRSFPFVRYILLSYEKSGVPIRKCARHTWHHNQSFWLKWELYPCEKCYHYRRTPRSLNRLLIRYESLKELKNTSSNKFFLWWRNSRSSLSNKIIHPSIASYSHLSMDTLEGMHNHCMPLERKRGRYSMKYRKKLLISVFIFITIIKSQDVEIIEVTRHQTWNLIFSKLHATSLVENDCMRITRES